MKMILNIIFLLFAISCVNNTPSDNKASSNEIIPEISIQKNAIIDSIRTIIFDSSDFEMKIYCLGDNENLFPVYALNKKTGKELFLFEIFHLIASNNPEHLFGEYYSFHFEDTGNSIYAQGFYLIKVTRDTAFMIAPYSGYEDIDGDGKKEFFVYDLEEMGESHAANKYYKLEVELRNDSLPTEWWF